MTSSTTVLRPLTDPRPRRPRRFLPGRRSSSSTAVSIDATLAPIRVESIEPTTTGIDPEALAALARRVDRHGLAGVDSATLVAVAGWARASGLHPALADALVDVDTPEVVRARIVGRLHRLAAGRGPAPARRLPTAA